MDVENVTEIIMENVTKLMDSSVDEACTTELAWMQDGDAAAMSSGISTMSLIMSLLCSCVNIILNSLNIVVTSSEHLNFPISNRLAVYSMSSADILLGFSVIIRFAFIQFVSFICRVHMVISVTCVRISVVSLILIIVDRYIAIVYPFVHYRYATKRTCMSILVAAWIFTTIADIIENATGNYFFNPQTSLCTVRLSATRSAASATIIYFIPLTSMCLVYTHLIVIIRRMVREMVRIYPQIPELPTINRTNTTATTSASASTVPEPVIAAESLDRELPRRACPANDRYSEYKIVLTFFAVTIAFSVSQVPHRIIRLMTLVGLAVPSHIILASRLILLSGSWCNFFIFSAMNSNFRRVLKRLFCRRCETSL